MIDAALAALTGPLRMLDVRLADALAAGQEQADHAGSAGPAADLVRTPGAPRFAGGTEGGLTPLTNGVDGGLARLAVVFGLSPLDLDLLLIAVAPDVDRRYEGLYGHLQGEGFGGRATVDLATDLVSTTATAKAESGERLSPAGPLVRYGVIRVEAAPGATRLTRVLVPDAAIVTSLLGGQPGGAAVAAPRAGGSRVRHHAHLAFAPADRDRLHHLLQGVGEQATVLDCRIAGTDVDDLTLAGEAVAARLDRPLLVSLTEEGQDHDAAARVRATLLEAILTGAVACFVVPAATAAAAPGPPAALKALLAEPLRAVCHTIVALQVDAKTAAAVEAGGAAFHLRALDYADRPAAWRAAAADAGLHLPPAQIDLLSSRFNVTLAMMARVCAAATARRAKDHFPALLTALRVERGRDLALLAGKVDGTQGWDDLILPPLQTQQLHDLCAQVVHRHRVEAEWGFADKLGLGRGVCVLFAGPSGTGKTMAAGVVARALDLDLYRIDLSKTVSKFIGETEKNLDRIFNEAATADAVLFFDEADTLFGKRTDVKDAHDRYANLEVGYLLQKMEEFDGVAILATNLRQHIDEAFIRRLRAIVEFPFPDEADRLRIWRTVFPAKAPLAADVDLAALARDVRLTGGSIRNIALSAAFLAATGGSPIGQVQLIAAARDEYRKLGRAWSAAA